MLQRLDKNGNGQLDKDEQDNLPDFLKAADENGDGIIDRAEIAAAMAQLGSDGEPGGPQARDRREGRSPGVTP